MREWTDKRNVHPDGAHTTQHPQATHAHTTTPPPPPPPPPGGAAAIGMATYTITELGLECSKL